MQKEQEFVDKLIPFFRLDFTVYEEVTSECGNRRIDLVLTHKLNHDISFGIECKVPDSKRGEQIGEYFKQAIEYTKLKWFDGTCYRKIPILLCPPLSYKYFVLNEEEKLIDNNIWIKDRHQPESTHHTVNGFLGAFNVGEVRKESRGYFFSMSNKVLFENFGLFHNTRVNRGVHIDNYNYIIKKINL